MANRQMPIHPEFIDLASQPGRRIAFSVMTYYKLYVPLWVVRTVELFFSLQSLLLLLLWVMLHFAFLTYPTICINQSDLFPNISQLSATDVLRISIWHNYTIPLGTFGHSSSVCLRPNYTDLLQSYSTHPVSHTSITPQLQNSPSFYNLLVSQDTFMLLGDVDEDTDTLLFETEIVQLNHSHVQITTLLESMEFSSYEGILRLPLEVRDQLGVNTSRAELDYFSAECLQLSMGFIPVAALVGFDEIILQSFRHLSKNYFNSTGYVQDLRSREIYRFYSAYFDRSLLLFAIFPILMIALMNSNLMWFCHVIMHHMLLFIRFTDDHITPVFISLATMTLLYALFGIFAFMTGLLNDDGPLCLIVMLAVFSGDQYYLVFCNHPVSKRQWPKFFYLFLFVFVAYFLRFNGQLFLYALVSCYMLLTLSMVYFLHNWELPLVERAMRQGGLSIWNNNQHSFRAAFHKYNLLLAQMQRPPHQLIQVEIQVGPVMPPPPPPPPPVPQDNRPLVPQDNRPLVPQANMPLVPQANRPLVPQANMPLVPQANRPLVPQDNRPLVPLVPQDNKPLVPQDNKPLVPQDNRPLVPQDNRPLVPQDNKPLVPQANKPLVPQSNPSPVPQSNRPLEQ